MSCSNFHFRVFNALGRIFGIVALIAGSAFSYSAIKSGAAIEYALALLAGVMGVAFLLAKSSRPDLPSFEGARSWWTGEPKNPSNDGS